MAQGDLQSQRPDRGRTLRVIRGPASVNGGISRLVAKEDGFCAVETWGGPDKGWRLDDGTEGSSVLKAVPVSPGKAARFGLPASEVFEGPLPGA